VPLGAGLDTKTNEKLLKPPAAADLSDAIFPASGIAGYETRLGYTKINTATTLTDIDALVTRDSELTVCADHNLYGVSELANNVDLHSKGELLAVKVTESILDTQSVNQSLGQVITYGGLKVHCWLDSGTGTVKWTATDASTGTIITANNSIANSTRAKLAKSGSAILLIYYQSSAASLRCTVIPTYSPTSTSDVELKSDAITPGIFDCIEDPSNTKVFVAYYNNDGAANVAGFLVDEAGSTDSTVDVIASVTPVCLAVSRDWNKFACVAATATNMYAASSDDTGFASIASGFTSFTTVKGSCINLAFAIEQTEDQAEDGKTHFVWAEFAATGSPPFDTAQFNYVDCFETEKLETLGTGFASPDTTIQQSSIASSGFLVDNEGWCHLAYDSPLQSMYFLVNIDAEVHAKCCITKGAGVTAVHLPRVIDGAWAPVFREKLDLDLAQETADDGAESFAQTGLKQVVYDFAHRPSAVQVGRTAYIAGGILWAYDGNQLVEQGFHIYPETFDTATATTGGSLVDSTSYSYRIYYEWTNARGERQRSTTAKVVTKATGASADTNTVTISIPTLNHTHKGTNVSIVVYRAEGNPNIVGGEPFFRVSDADPSSSGTNGYLANDPTAATVDFVDGLADASLIERELDYLNSGERDNTGAPSSSVIGESKNRVWLADKSVVQFSKLNSRGRDQLEFHDGNDYKLRIPEHDGDVTAINSLNFHTVVFKPNSCYAISGEGPNNLGAGFFNLPQVASLDVGCVEQRSIASIPDGLIFKSKKGFWLLGHNLDTQYVGANVELYNSQTVTSATVIPSENHVVFLTDSGRTLVYNYLVKAWSTWKNHAGNHSVMWGDTFVYARTNGKIYKQSATAYADDGVHYTMRFVTAPISLRGAQGKQHVRQLKLLGTYFDPHNLRVGVRYDHEPGTQDEGTWDPSDGITVDLYGDGAYGSGAYGGAGTAVYQAKFNLPRQRCQTVQFVIDTVNTGNAGRAVSIQAMQIEVGTEEFTHELSVDSTFSATGASTT